MIGINQAISDMLEAVERNVKRLDKIRQAGGALGRGAFGMRTDLLHTAANLRGAMGDIDKPDHVCPLCAQPKYQVELIKLIKGLKSCEVWADDGQSWTIDVAAFEGNPDAVCGAMIDIIRGEYIIPVKEKS